MSVWQSVAGELEARLLTADPAGALDAIARANIPLSHVIPAEELTLTFRIRRMDYPRLRFLADRRGERLTVSRRFGLYWQLKRLTQRPVLVFGLCFLLAASLWIPTRVFFFRVEGNTNLSQRQILAAAENCGIRFGASREKIRSEKIKNSLLSQIPELKWAGINTHGCVAVIQVAEKQEAQESDRISSGLCHIVASRDGVVAGVTATAGTPLCAPGQAIVKGQVLISGLTDCGIAMKMQQAQGEVTARTARTIAAVTPENRLVRGSCQKTITRRSLIIGKKRIKLWIGSGIWDAGCGRIYQEYPLVLPGGFRLPVALAVDTIKVCTLEEGDIPPECAQTRLHAFAEGQLRQAMLGGTVQKAVETLSRKPGVFLLTGSYSCLEVISRPKWEQIGDMHE